jgi:hypothetical protein
VPVRSRLQRLIGRRFSDPSVQADMKHWPFKVLPKGDKPMIEIMFKGEAKQFAPEEISAMVLTKMKVAPRARARFLSCSLACLLPRFVLSFPFLSYPISRLRFSLHPLRLFGLSRLSAALGAVHRKRLRPIWARR